MRKRKSIHPLIEIGFLAPRVVAMRLARFADTRPAARRRNIAEATRMKAEKSAALVEGSLAAGAAMMRAQWNPLGPFSKSGSFSGEVRA